VQTGNPNWHCKAEVNWWKLLQLERFMNGANKAAVSAAKMKLKNADSKTVSIAAETGRDAGSDMLKEKDRISRWNKHLQKNLLAIDVL